MTRKDAASNLELVLSLPDGARLHRLSDAVTTIGRGPECTLQIEHSKLSRIHCALEIVDENEVILVDEGSRNGVLVDGQRVEEQLLRAGDAFNLAGRIPVSIIAAGGAGIGGAPAEIGGYRILGPIGHRGVAGIFRALDVEHDEIVALEVVPPLLGPRDAFDARLDREAQVLLDLDHANIIHALEMGEADGFTFLAMEYVDSADLAVLVERDGILEEGTALGIAAQVADGLGHAADRGFVHRDIKPDNLLLDADGVVKIAGYGIAGFLDEAAASKRTRTEAIRGSPHYMSPEQVRAQPLDSRSDLYSLGATLYHLLTGEPPYAGESAFDLMSAQVREPVPDARRRMPGLQKATARIIQRAMAKDPAERYAEPEAMAEALRIVLGTVSGKPVAIARAEPIDPALEAPDPVDDAESGRDLAETDPNIPALDVAAEGKVGRAKRPRPRARTARLKKSLRAPESSGSSGSGRSRRSPGSGTSRSRRPRPDDRR